MSLIATFPRFSLRIAAVSSLAITAALFSADVHAATVLPPSDANPAAASATPQADPSTLRICAAANQLPFSSQNGSGFENKIATIVAKAMDKKPVFVWANKQAIFLVRDWLDKKKCDVVVGLDTGDPRVLTTKPYYRASYVFVSKKGAHDGIESWNDPKVKDVGHIVVDLGSPSEEMLKEKGLYNEDMAYLYSLVGFRAPRNEYVQITPEKMIGEVKSGEAGLAVAFAPDIARFVKDDPALKLVPVKDDATHNGGEKLPQTYDQSMGVRRGDAELLQQLDAALVKAKPEVDAALRDEGIPLVAAHN